jgi:hypothetical protein
MKEVYYVPAQGLFSGIKYVAKTTKGRVFEIDNQKYKEGDSYCVNYRDIRVESTFSDGVETERCTDGTCIYSNTAIWNSM